MARLMSVTLTEQAVVERRKTVTRRLGWLMLKPGDELDLCRKVMGRRKGDPLVRLARVRVTDVRRERLDMITDEEVAREGFTREALSGHARLGGGSWDGADDTASARFVRFFIDHMGGTREQEVTRIEWEYLASPDSWEWLGMDR